MKKSVPKLILYLILLIKACAVVIPDYENVPLLICVGITMVALALVVFIDTKHSMAKHLLWYAVAGILLFFALAKGLPYRFNFGRAIGNFLESIFYAADSSKFMGCLLFFGVLQLLFRKNNSTIFIILRYVAACILMVTLSERMFGGSWMFIPVGILCLVYELNSTLSGARCPRLFAYILFCLLCLMVNSVFGGVNNQILAFISLRGDSWLYLVLTVAVVGLLLILENWNNVKILNEHAPADCELGEALLCWCLLAVAMRMWNNILNTVVLFILFPFIFHIYCVFLHSYRRKPGNSRKPIFVKSWLIILLGLVTFSKSLNFAPFTAATMSVLAVAGYLCWNASSRHLNKPNIMTGFLGIAAIVLTASMSFRSLSHLQDNISAVITMLVACLMWLYICSESGKISAKASEAYPAEYNRLIPIQRICAAAALLVAAIRVIAL